MWKVLTILVTSIVLFAATVSCNKEDSNPTVVEIKAYCDSPTEPASLVRPDGLSLNMPSFYRHFEFSKVYDKDDFYDGHMYLGYRLKCKDPNALLKLEIYVNGKIADHKEGNSDIVLKYALYYKSRK